MVGLFRKPRLEQGSPQWNDLFKNLEAFSRDLWAYLIEIDEGDWDEPKVKSRVDQARQDIKRAQISWPAGKSILRKLLGWFDKSVQVREQEHAMVLSASLNRVPDLSKSLRRSAQWQKAMAETERALIKTGEEMLTCCDEVKKWTGIDLRTMLETPQIPGE